MKRRLRVGKKFDVNVKFVQATTERRVETSRSAIVFAFLGVTGLFLIGAALLGLIEGSFEKLQTVYNAVAVPFGMMVLHYFGRLKKAQNGQREYGPSDEGD